ncbi:MAG: hypothetical protein KatS3mg017_0111 [Fimbriimonadales bacterium]|nr:MAG: hypothetical protein KatS3mg017_0111 [Fimbriimonadales bacterium]
MHGDRERAVHRAHAPIQRQLAHNRCVLQRLERNLLGHGKDTHSDGQIVGGSLFAHIGRRKVHRELKKREIEPGVADGGAYAVARFLYRGVGQSDQRPVRRARLQVHLHLNGERFDAVQGCALHSREHTQQEYDTPDPIPAGALP